MRAAQFQGTTPGTPACQWRDSNNVHEPQGTHQWNAIAAWGATCTRKVGATRNHKNTAPPTPKT